MRSDWLSKKQVLYNCSKGGRISPWGNYEQLNSRMFSLKQHNTNHNIKYKLEIWNHIHDLLQDIWVQNLL